MNHTLKTGLYLLLAGTLQACSSSSDMGAGFPSPQQAQPDSAAAQEAGAGGSGGSESAGLMATGTTNNGTQGQAGESQSSTAGNGSNSTQTNSELVAGASTVLCEASAEAFRDTMLAVINESRQRQQMCGTDTRQPVSIVSWNNRLTSAASAHAQDMVTANFFSHSGSDGLGVSDRADTAAYDWRAIGENIAAGQLDIQEVHQGWLDSPGHCRNIMNSLYSEVGAACLSNGNTDFGTYWVVVFGDQR